MKSGIRLQLPLLAALILALCAPLLPQEKQLKRKDVPEAVLAAFTQAYPNARIKGFSTEPENGQPTYEIESVEGSTARDVTYLADGTLVSVEETLEPSDVPSAVLAAVNRRFPGGKIRRVEKVTKGDVVGYEFEIRHNGKKTEIVFDPEGNEVTDLAHPQTEQSGA